MSIERAIGKITHARLALILMAICIIILINPLFLPMRVSNLANDFYGYVQRLQPGDKVLISGTWGPANFNTLRTFYKALLNSIASKGARFVIWSVDPSFAGLVGTKPGEDGINLYCGFSGLYNYQYGVDYAYLPYLPGEETAIAAVAANIRSAFSGDVYGTPIPDIPIFAAANSLPDFKLAIFGEVSYTVPEMYVRQWPVKYEVATISYSLFSLIGAYYPRYIKGDLDSTTGYAEYEFLTKTPGEYILRMDVRNMNVTLTFVLIALTNIAILQSRRKKVEAT
jgi:hypothetical protein